MGADGIKTVAINGKLHFLKLHTFVRMFRSVWYLVWWKCQQVELQLLATVQVKLVWLLLCCLKT